MKSRTPLFLLAVLSAMAGAVIFVSTQRLVSWYKQHNAPHAQFGPSGYKTSALVSADGVQPAVVTIITGVSLTAQGDIEGGDQNLAYVITGFPGASWHGGGTETHYKGDTITEYWTTDASRFDTSLNWNKITDTISAAGREFSRKNGNVFVISGHSERDVECQQLPSLGSTVGGAEVLRYVQQQRPNDAFLNSLKVRPD